jgi:type IV secretory pathway TraG/TraD family ATPase VirD4
MDEAQLHALPTVDSQTQAVARKHRLIQVAITQNIPLLISTVKSKEDALAWIGNLQTKFIFANTDPQTNQYFSTMFGQQRKLMGSYDGGKPYDPVLDWMGQDHGGHSFREEMQPAIRPEEFVTLRKGGVAEDFLVDCYVSQGGRVFSNGRTYTKMWIKQRV